MTIPYKPTSSFDHDNAQLTDKITVIGCLEHIYEHACKSAASSKEEDAVFFQTVSEMAKDFRRDFMREHFPDVDEKSWCLLKATDTLRQRVYECANTSYSDLKRVNELWATVMEHIFETDLSGCVACREDKKVFHRANIEAQLKKEKSHAMEIQIGDGPRTIYD